MSKAAVKRPRDINSLAKLVAEMATGDELITNPPDSAPRGRAGGLVGGAARAKALTPITRKKIATKAAKARWTKRKATSQR